MKRKNIIVVIAPEKEPETWGNFKKMCDSKKLPYHSLKMKGFPITFNDVVIYRVPFL